MADGHKTLKVPTLAALGVLLSPFRSEGFCNGEYTFGCSSVSNLTTPAELTIVFSYEKQNK